MAGGGAPANPVDPAPMISMRGVNKHFGDLHVLKDINLDIGRGQVVVVIGPSGSGKSTLCRTINRLESPDSGTVAIDGEPVAAEGRKLARLRSEVGMVFQSFNLFAHKTVLDNVTLAPIKVLGVARAQARQTAMALLERVGVADQALKYPAQLSGGQQQRVAIARAIVTRPTVLLADEPTGNLDSQRGHEIMQLLVQMNRDQGLTILMVTHEADMAAYASRVVHFLDGQVARSWDGARDGRLGILQARFQLVI